MQFLNLKEFANKGQIMLNSDKTFIAILNINSREGKINMICEYCGKPIKEFDDFILVGKYPTKGQMWKWSEANYYIKPENYGKVYHKRCFAIVFRKLENQE